jgi:hypothetical protein
MDNGIQGLMVDTAWRIMRQYVRAILMAIFHNVWIQIAIAFGATASLDLFESFYVAFRELFK